MEVSVGEIGERKRKEGNKEWEGENETEGGVRVGEMGEDEVSPGEIGEDEVSPREIGEEECRGSK